MSCKSGLLSILLSDTMSFCIKPPNDVELISTDLILMPTGFDSFVSGPSLETVLIFVEKVFSKPRKIPIHTKGRI
ncbi:hypothetical protein BC833DRAFT_613165 [Globomyces pollinis-pini]|nr:hypothetical protein BC833DRAFT_613165 [Globomyces pollinis-pini]